MQRNYVIVKLLLEFQSGNLILLRVTTKDSAVIVI